MASVVELTQLWLPIVVSAIALFFLGYLTWMVLPLHAKDWLQLPDEEAFGESIRGLNVPPGNYMFPYCSDGAEMKSEEFIARQQRGPNGIVQLWQGPCNMGKSLGLQFLALLLISFCLAYLATLGLPAGAEFLPVFRFVGTAGILTYCAAHLPAGIWFKSRITGHLIEGVLYGLTTGVIFALFWPGAAA